MGRWAPDSRGRLMNAALELYAEKGYDQTTALDVAARAGVTERTFFRYFADKREVLFDGAGALQDAVTSSIAASPAGAAPVDTVCTAMQHGAATLPEREDARRRAAVVAATPALQERELLKLSRLGAATAQALRQRGVGDLAAVMAAETGVLVFRLGFEAWIADGSSSDLAGSIRAALAELRALTAQG